MRKILSLLAAAMVVTSPPAQAAPRLTPEAKLARALEGRVAGEPVRCIDTRNARSEIIDGTAIIYRTGNTIYVNRPESGAESLNDWDTLVTRTFGSRLCSVDVVHLYDMSAGFPRGTVFLGDFVPYRRVETSAR